MKRGVSGGAQAVALLALGMCVCGAAPVMAQAAAQVIAPVAVAPVAVPIATPVVTPIAAPIAAPDTSVGGALVNLASRSGVAFVGDVTAVRYLGGTVAVDFRVEQTLLGSVGASYTLREWGGLWAAGQRRYWVGERVAIFLHAPGKGGLSSPVDGMEGVLPVVQQGAQSAPMLDVRRLAARVLRAQGAPIAGAGNGAMALADAAAVVANWKQPSLPEPVRVPLPVGVVKQPPAGGPLSMQPVVSSFTGSAR